MISPLRMARYVIRWWNTLLGNSLTVVDEEVTSNPCAYRGGVWRPTLSSQKCRLPFCAALSKAFPLSTRPELDESEAKALVWQWLQARLEKAWNSSTCAFHVSTPWISSSNQLKHSFTHQVIALFRSIPAHVTTPHTLPAVSYALWCRILKPSCSISGYNPHIDSSRLQLSGLVVCRRKSRVSFLRPVRGSTSTAAAKPYGQLMVTDAPWLLPGLIQSR